MSRLDEIRARLAGAGELDEGDTLLIANAPADLAYLLAEVERLQGETERERAAVVEWLLTNGGPPHEGLRSGTWRAAAIEHGEHRKP